MADEHAQLPDAITLSVDDIYSHLRFLRKVHTAGGDVFAGEPLAVAIDRYERLWLPLVGALRLATRTLPAHRAATSDASTAHLTLIPRHSPRSYPHLRDCICRGAHHTRVSVQAAASPSVSTETARAG